MTILLGFAQCADQKSDVILSVAKDLTPATRSVLRARVLPFGEILRLAQDDNIFFDKRWYD